MKFKLVISSIFLPIALCSWSGVRAQSDNIDFQTWSDFTYTYNLKNKASIGADIGMRGLVSKNEWNQFYLRPTYKYFFNRAIHAAGGVAIFTTVSDILENTTEFRIFQEVKFGWPSLAFAEFSHRIRFEQRFFTYQEDPQLSIEIPNDYKSRTRYKLNIESIDIHLGDKNKPIYFVASWEWFYDFNNAAIEQFVNNQRFLGGLGQRLTPRFKYEIQYIFQNSNRFSDEGVKTTEHILRVRLFLMSKPRPEN